MRWSFIQRVRRTVSAPKYKTKDESCSSRSAPLVLGQLQRPVAERERVVGLQSHNVACGRGDGTAGPYISRIRTGVFHKQRRRTRMKGREAHSQLGKTGAYGETDLAVVVLASAFSPRSQAALRSTRAILRSQVACGAINGVIAAIGTIIVTSLHRHFTSRPEIQLQAHFFGPALGNGELEAAL